GAPFVERRLELELDGLVLPALGHQEQARAVEIRPAVIEIRAADREVVRVDRDRDRELCRGAPKPPRALVRLLRGKRPPVTLAANRNDMTSELAKQVAAGNPRRHSHALRRRRVLDAQLDLEQMAARIE